MRRILSLILSAVMILTMFSVLGVVASADSEGDSQIGTDVLPEGGDVTGGGNTEGSEGSEGGNTSGNENTEGEVPDGNSPEGGEGEITPDPDESLTSVEFVPADADDYRIYPYSGGGFEWEYNEETETYGFVYNYWFLNELYGEGNRLIFTDEDGNETVYVCDEEWYFVNESGDCLDEEPLVYSVEEDEAGNLVLEIEYGDLSCQYPYEFIESEIDHIAPLNETPILVEAYRDGYYDRLISGENEGELAYLYDTVYNKSFGFVITYKDGTARTVSVNEESDLVFEDTGEVVAFYDLADKNSQVYCEWAAGETYTVEYYFEGVPFEVRFEVSENPVASVDYVQIGESDVLHYGVDGYYSFCDHEECNNVYFEFDQTEVFPASEDIITLTYKDGTSQVLRWENGWLIGEDGEYYNEYICLYDDQYNNHWTEGEYTFFIRLLGCEDDVTVTVEGRETEGVNIFSESPVTVYENTDGTWEVDDNGNEIFIYDYSVYRDGVIITVNYDNGSFDEYYYDESEGCFVDEFYRCIPYEIIVSDTQFAESWGLGEHTVNVEIDGCIADFNVTVIESPVESIEFIISKIPVFGFEDENDGGWLPGEENSEGEFIYSWSEEIIFAEDNLITVDFTDGTSVTYCYDADSDEFIDDDGNCLPYGYDIAASDRQMIANWTPYSDDNYIIVSYMGARDYIPVVIDNGEKPVASVVESISNTETGVEITWSKVNNAEEYLVYRRLEKTNGKASSNPWVLVGSTNELSFVDTFELKDGAYYKYHIHTKNSNGQSAYNGSAALTGRYIAPVKAFTVANTKSGVLFNWQKVSGYKIRLFRLEKGSDEWVYLGEKNSDSSNVYNATAKSGKTYIYAAAYYVDGVASAIVYSDYITCLEEPHLKTIKNAVTGIYFNWTAVEGAQGYRVYRRAAGEKYFTYLGTTTNLWYCDNAVRNNNGTYYKYTVKAIAEDGTMSSYEGGLLLRRLVMPYIQSLTNVENGITVKWAEIPGATSYRVYRRGAGQTTWTYITSVTNALSYTDTAVKNSTGSYYRYTIKAVVNGIFTDYNPDGPYTMRVATPVLSGATSVADGISVKWGAVKGAQGYHVYRKTADTSWVLIGTVGGTSYVDKNAPAGVECTYSVQAYKGGYKGSYNSKGVSA